MHILSTSTVKLSSGINYRGVLKELIKTTKMFSILASFYLSNPLL